MLIRSFVKTTFGFRPVSVEVVLVPGVSQIQILGLADQVIKESSKRIISALRHQGYKVPPGKQVLVNLHPSDFKKSGQGLDLPIALGILLESKQLEIEDYDFSENYCYGELTLKGEVLVPSDLNLLNFENFEKKVLTGPNNSSWRFAVEEVTDLNSLTERTFRSSQPDLFKCTPSSFNQEMNFPLSMARLMSIVALGEHPLMIAGYAGSGKTTLVENLATLLNLPDPKVYLESKKYWMLAGRDLKGRPIVQPHHSATATSMIGGGRPLKFGEISLAHGGALILDEMLEFHPLVQSALREPMEKGLIYLSRIGMRQVFPADCLVLATTNLCPCGSFQPGATYQCQCSSLKLRNYIERLTGPFLDRFAIFYIVEKPKNDLVTNIQEIKSSIVNGREFQFQTRDQSIVNQKLPAESILKQLDSNLSANLIPYSKSHRRRQSLLRVARTLADLDASETIKQAHLEEAQTWSSSGIYKLERFRIEDFAMS